MTIMTGAKTGLLMNAPQHAKVMGGRVKLQEFVTNCLRRDTPADYRNAIAFVSHNDIEDNLCRICFPTRSIWWLHAETVKPHKIRLLGFVLNIEMTAMSNICMTSMSDVIFELRDSHFFTSI